MAVSIINFIAGVDKVIRCLIWRQINHSFAIFNMMIEKGLRK